MQPVHNALTIDFESWADTEVVQRALPAGRLASLPARHEAGVRRILELLDAYGVHATFFVTGQVARSEPALVARIAAGGHELACHHDAHVRLVHHAPERFRAEVRAAVDAIQSASGRPVLGYRAPTWSIADGNLGLLRVLDELGFRYDSSIQPDALGPWGVAAAPLHPFRIQGLDLLEIPPTAVTLPLLGTRLPAGGGFFLRALPTRPLAWYLRRLNRHRVPGVVWVHTWEFDAAQPRLPLNAVGRLLQYHNLDSVEGRLRFLLERAGPFGRMQDLLEGPAGWPRIDLGLAA